MKTTKVGGGWKWAKGKAKEKRRDTDRSMGFCLEAEPAPEKAATMGLHLEMRALASVRALGLDLGEQSAPWTAGPMGSCSEPRSASR